MNAQETRQSREELIREMNDLSQEEFGRLHGYYSRLLDPPPPELVRQRREELIAELYALPEQEFSRMHGLYYELVTQEPPELACQRCGGIGDTHHDACHDLFSDEQVAAIVAWDKRKQFEGIPF